MINITVIGFGNVGASLSLLLLNSQHSIRLNVMDPNPECEGAILDLSHGLSLFRDKELHINDDELFQQAHFIYYAAGAPNLHGGSRLSTAKQNIQLSKDIFENRNFVNKPYIIVITNPVDIISQSVYKYSGLPHDHVIGTGTFLDSIRLEYYLSRLSGLNINSLKATVIGEHGDSQVPVYSQTQVEGQSILQHPAFSNEDLEQARILTKGAAFTIRETQEATLYGVSKCAAILLDYLLGSEDQDLVISMLTNEHYRNVLKLNQDIYIGLPVRISDGHIRINNSLEFSDEEIKAFQHSAEILTNTLEQHRFYD